MVLERVRKCPLVYPIVSAVYIPYVRSLYPIGDAPGAPHLGPALGPVMPQVRRTWGRPWVR